MMSKQYTHCDRCTMPVRKDRGKVQVRAVFGIHAGSKRVWERKPRHWCGACRAVMDGHWRYFRED